MKPISRLQQKRKFLLVLPVIVVLFGTFTCWSLGLGSGPGQIKKEEGGINTRLPEAKVADKATDKMSLYNEAEQDSIAKKHASGMDPFAGSDSLLAGYDTIPSQPVTTQGGGPSLSYGSYSTYPDAGERKVRDKLAELEKALSAQEAMEEERPFDHYPGDDNSPRGDIRKLEQMMAAVSSSQQDPEVSQLSELMDKVLDVQYPGRAQQKLREQSEKNKGRVYTVAPRQDRTRAEVMKRPGIVEGARLIDSGLVSVYEPLPDQNTFYGLDKTTTADEGQRAIAAIIHGTQTVLTGSTVKMMLTEEVMVSGLIIPAGSFIHGFCSINGERLLISVPGLRFGKHQIPVSLKAFGLDGLEGIPVPGAITRDAAKDGAGQMAQSMQLMTLDPSLYAQAAGVGVEVAKGLFSKKAKLVRATVKAGEPLLLVDEKSLQDAN